MSSAASSRHLCSTQLNMTNTLGSPDLFFVGVSFFIAFKNNRLCCSDFLMGFLNTSSRDQKTALHQMWLSEKSTGDVLSDLVRVAMK